MMESESFYQEVLQNDFAYCSHASGIPYPYSNNTKNKINN